MHYNITNNNTNINKYMNINDKISEIYYCISSERKDSARKRISNRFGISVDSAKINWIYNKKTPPEHAEEVLKILRDEVKTQANQLNDLIK